MQTVILRASFYGFVRYWQLSADAIGTASLHIRPSASPREASRNDSLAEAKTIFIVTGRLSPFREETRARRRDARRRAKLYFFSGGRRPPQLTPERPRPSTA